MKIQRSTLLKISAIALLGILMLPTAQAKTVLIDVRTPEEFQVAHLDGAINLPYTDIVSLVKKNGIQPQDNIKVYSRGGSRAEQAKNALKEAGYQKVEIEQKK